MAHLELVGFTKRNGNIDNYCQSTVRHFSFKNNYFSDDRPIHINKKQHPTWNLEADETKYKFGGILQDSDKNPFIHLVTFDEIPSGLKISGLSSLTLGMHIRELNECGAVFYQHDNFGKPSKIGETKKLKSIQTYQLKKQKFV